MTEEMEVVSIIIVTKKENKMPGHYGKKMKKPMKKKGKKAKKAKKSKMKMY